MQPNQFALEKEYYQRGIDMTQEAYGIDGLEKTNFEAVTDVGPNQLREDAATTAQIRIMDPTVISPTVRQLEQYRSYYQFQDPLDVDRYDDRRRVAGHGDVGARAQHGPARRRGVVAEHDRSSTPTATASSPPRATTARPTATRSSSSAASPPPGFLSDQEDFEPRVYFGEYSPTYSIVGAPEGTDPTSSSTTRRARTAPARPRRRSRATAGRASAASSTASSTRCKFQSEQILFSDYVNEDSQILYDRDPSARVQKAAPYLDARQRPVPERRRRPHRLDHRRLHA